MTVAEYLVDYLVNIGVTDAFGIPGGVILKFLEAINARSKEIKPHLCYHEQTAGFAGCGYAQSSHKLGVVYATRGPGITNLVTCMAEAYQESIPILFITAHANKPTQNLRAEYDQELDICKSVKLFTKYADTIDTLEEVAEKIEKACFLSMNGRKGPVLLDFSARLWNQVIKEKENVLREEEGIDYNEIVEKIEDKIGLSSCPVILIGDGIRQANAEEIAQDVLGTKNIPIISSRAAQDIMRGSSLFYGYVGSHGMRYTNMILTKADLMIVLGNRLSFPKMSESFKPAYENKEIIRIDIDKEELEQELPDTVSFCGNVAEFIEKWGLDNRKHEQFSDWINICNIIKSELNDFDISSPVKKLIDVIEKHDDIHTYVCDVGNNEFWFSRAYEYERPNCSVLYSKSFGTLGSAIGKAIGVYYGTRKPVMCIVGDQGLQYNIQELQYVAQWNMPIGITVVNNRCSGMIRDNEDKIIDGDYIHISRNNGYMPPNIKGISEAYGIPYYKETCENTLSGPFLLELSIEENIKLSPSLPKGNRCYDMEPIVEKSLLKYLVEL